MNSKLVRSKLPCPSCTSSDAYHEYDDGHGFCFSCKTYFPSPNKEFNLSEYTYEYLPWRGVSAETFKFFDVKTKIDETGKPVAIGYKYPNASYKVRSLAEKDFRVEGDINKAGLFGRDKFSSGSHKFVTITEGELDACSLYQILKSPVVSVQSSATAARDATVDRSWLNNYERIYLALDNDERGREAAASIAKLFDYNKVYHVRFDRYKDANDYLQNNAVDEVRNLWWNARKYQPENIVSSFQDFEKILNEKSKPSIPYPFPTLTSMTYGIRTGESVLITAQEGVGKTELMHAIEYNILKETSDEVGVGAIFLEEPKKRHLQAVAGLELKRPAHLPDAGCSPSEIIAALRKAVSKDERLHVYSHFGSDDPEVLLDTIRFLVSSRSCLYILLDHLTMAVSGLAGEDERRALDYLSTRLEMMVKELDFSLILVSHVNDEGLTRGSRYISKIADIRIDAKRDVSNPDPDIRNTTFLTVSKNRFSGRTGPAGELVFDPTTYTFKEKDTWTSASLALDTKLSLKQSPTLVPSLSETTLSLTGESLHAL